MPTYAYTCTECGHAFDIHQSFDDAPLTVCPQCRGKLRKVFSPVGVVFKGSGFYRTDARAGGKSSSSGSSGASSSSSSSSGTTKESVSSGSSAPGDKGGSSGASSSGSSGSSGSSSATSAAAKAASA